MNQKINSDIAKQSSKIQSKYDQKTSQQLHNLASTMVGQERDMYKNDKDKINPRLIESWIEDFLCEAERANLPSTHMKGDNQTALARQNLDRNTLQSHLIPQENADRLYRTLFVHSIGFQQTLSQLTFGNTKAIADTWVVQNVLLEYCCRTEYTTHITNLTETFKKNINDLSCSMKEEIDTLTNKLDQKNEDIKNLTIKVDHLESDLNKEKNIKNSQQKELQNSIAMHESEVKMRLRFENTLANISGMYKELEARFLVLTKELELTSLRLHETYGTLKEQKDTIDILNKTNIDIESENSKIYENQKMNIEVLNQKTELIKTQSKELEDAKNLIQSLKDKIAFQDTTIRELQTSLVVQNEVNGNLETEKDLRSQKISMREEYINHQEQVVNRLSADLMGERQDNEDVKNKLTVAMAKVKEYFITIERNKIKIKNDGDTILKLRENENRLSCENKVMNQKITQLTNDQLDCMIKLNLTVQVRQETEKQSQNLSSTSKEMQDKLNQLESEKKKDFHEIIRLRGVNDAFQKEICILESQKKELNRLMKAAQVSFESELQSSYSLVQKEGLIRDKLFQTLEEEKEKQRMATSMAIKNEKRWNEQEVSMSRLKIELNSITSRFNEISKKQEDLKFKHNQEVNEHQQDSNRLRWHNETVENIMHDHNNQIMKVRAEMESQIINLITDNNILSMQSEDLYTHQCNLNSGVNDLESKLSKRTEDYLKTKERNDKLELINKENIDKIKLLQDKVWMTNNEISNISRTSDNLENKVKKQQSKEEQFKGQIKGQIQETAQYKSTIEELSGFKKNQLQVKEQLDAYVKISKTKKELNFIYNASTLKASCQTDTFFAQPQQKKEDLKDDHKNEEMEKNTNHSSHIGKIRELYKTLEAKKDRLFETSSRNPEDLCPYCKRCDTNYGSQRDASTANTTSLGYQKHSTVKNSRQVTQSTEPYTAVKSNRYQKRGILKTEGDRSNESREQSREKDYYNQSRGHSRGTVMSEVNHKSSKIMSQSMEGRKMKTENDISIRDFNDKQDLSFLPNAVLPNPANSNIGSNNINNPIMNTNNNVNNFNLNQGNSEEKWWDGNVEKEIMKNPNRSRKKSKISRLLKSSINETHNEFNLLKLRTDY